MKHLTLEEMTAFISFQSLDGDSVELAAKVNGHICRCKECRDKLRAFQTVSEGLSDVLRSGPENVAAPYGNKDAAAMRDNEKMTEKKIPLSRKR